MYLRHRRAVAALLVSAALAVPGAALAADSPQSPLAETGKQPATGPSKEVAVDSTSFKVSRAEAISIATRMFSIPTALGEPNVNASESKEGAMWQIDYRTSGKQAQQLSISVGIDAQTGAVLSYNRYAAEAGKEPAPLSYTRAQALEKANFWLDMLAPALKPSIRAMDNPMYYGYYGATATYDFHWQRMAESYPVRNDSVNITIDARTGQLAAFNRGRWSAQAFKLPATILDKAKAEAAYRSQIRMELQYQYYQQPGTDTGEWKLVYRPNTQSYMMLNQEGKLIDNSGQPLNLDALAEMKLVPAADKPYQAPAKPLSKEEALQLAKAAAGRTDEPGNANYNEQGAEQKRRIWNFNWEAQDDKGGSYTNVGVDVDRGLIVNYSGYGPQQPLKEGEQPKFTETQAREAASQFIRSYRPDLAGNIMIMPSLESNPAYKAKMAQQQMYYVSFVMMKNGLQVADRQLSVNVDGMTGKVSSYWANDLESKQEFPAVTGVIKPEAATDAFLTSQGLEALWAQFYHPMTAGKGMQQFESQLVWGPGVALNVAAIDAKNGAPLDYQGRDLRQQGKRPTDIDGNPAEREIELLWVRGIVDLKDGKFNPGETATAGELARWLVMARGMQPYMSYDFRGNFAAMGAGSVAAKLQTAADSAYFGAALQNGIILPEDFATDSDPAAPVSRDLFALWTARAMGYGAVARMPNQIAMPFADQAKIGAKYANAVALLHGLGVVKGDKQTNFEPQRQVPRGEAAMFLFSVASESRR